MLRRFFLTATGTIALTTAAIATAACGNAPSGGNGAAQAAAPGNKTATIELEKGGTITIQLFGDPVPQGAPNTVKNFVQKANAGFYNGLTFHRVEDWVIQGGDPSGNGTGGGTMPSELNDRPFVVGAVGVARGPDIRINNDSQFFICLKESFHLNKQYTNFGQVTDGMNVAQGVKRGDKIKRITVK
jgi:cyclophilin family peptidyl-prolyl cis-trans isomerase